MRRFPAQSHYPPEIAASALSPDCVNYRVVGLCYWLYCTPLGCSVRTSVKVSHFRPDLVVSVYSNTGQNPWAEISLLSPPLPGVAEGGGDTNPRSASQHSKIRFKNADAIGFRQAMSWRSFYSVWLYLLTFIAAFSTVLSESTRYAGVARGVPEMTGPEALTPGMREVGQNGDMWGNIYPRAGAISQTHDYKAAAVIAQRAADLVTRTGQPHIYTPLTASSRAGYWPPSRLSKATAITIAGRCSRRKIRRLFGVPGWQRNRHLRRQAGRGWCVHRTLWRPYKCCPRRGKPSSAVRVNGGGDESPLPGLTVFRPVCVAADDYSFRTRGAVDDLLYYQIGGGEAVMPPPVRRSPSPLSF